MRKEGGVHRGKIDPGRTISLLQRLFPDLEELRIEGSLADRPRGSRYTDLDVSAKRPEGLTEEEIRELEIEIQEETGIDFYFRD